MHARARVSVGVSEEPTSQLVELEPKRDSKEGQLVPDRDEKSNGQIVIVQDVDRPRHIDAAAEQRLSALCG